MRPGSVHVVAAAARAVSGSIEGWVGPRGKVKSNWGCRVVVEEKSQKSKVWLLWSEEKSRSLSIRESSGESLRLEEQGEGSDAGCSGACGGGHSCRVRTASCEAGS